MVIFEKKATPKNIEEFIRIVFTTEPTRKLWENQINISNEHYDFSMKLLYINEICTERGYLVVKTNDNRELKFLIGEDTRLKIFKSE